MIVRIMEMNNDNMKKILVKVDQQAKHNLIFCLYWYFNNDD